MCGISGFLSNRVLHSSKSEEQLRIMCNAIAHRGPNASGTWVNAQNGVAIGHRRLSILDLSEAGSQPMTSTAGRFVATYNGEIYNHMAIRRELQSQAGANWRGHSDTETLLAGFDRWGVTQTLERAVGMFAIGVWDRDENCFYLARDRFGEKPLYYSSTADGFLFSSELKALRTHPTFNPEVSRDAIALLLRFGYIPAPHSIYSCTKKLLPGSVLRFAREGGSWRAGLVARYWSLQEVATNGLRKPFLGSEETAVENLESLLRDAIRLQQISDVPLGVFLSGGVDSSIVAALMQAELPRPIKTFSIGFHESQYDEASAAKEVSRRLGTDHTELYVGWNNALSVIPQLPEMYDEPLADPSQIPTYIVSKLAREKVTVALSGDAGDELFGGYARHFGAAAIDPMLTWLPGNVRRAVAHVASTSAQVLAGNRFSGESESTARMIERLEKLSRVLNAPSARARYLSLASIWHSPESIVIGTTEAIQNPLAEYDLPESTRVAEQMMFFDGIAYLPDNILIKLDRASMATSLETRCPFLDHRVAEWAWQLPVSMKIRRGKGKWILRELLRRFLPDHLVDRPKHGFSVPIDIWLRGPLRDWAESLLSTAALKNANIFQPEPVRAMWEEHVSGRRTWQQHLWTVLTIQAWTARWRPS
jgi:asparagine synthase (glutamine-hydrolysing)